MRPVAIFCFSPSEGPGRFAVWLDAQDLPWQLVALDRGDIVPADPRAFAGIGLMGGPMSANDDLPWTAPLIGLLRDALAAEVPIIGHCLGGQLLAKALGAKVTRAATPEIGWGEVSVSDPSARGWFGGREGFTTFQWHYDAFELPRGGVRVLTNPFNPEQAYVIGKHIGFQGHIEMTREMIDSWCRIGAAELPARSGGARQAVADIMQDLDARLAQLSGVADDVYTRWTKGLLR